uniref:Uncharacterized protein n=1 Tax=Oryza officinalis TaxID=4535 RepID=A0A1V1H0W1_9ORYZ|nr:hypothetical protein [Oryza officinalis]
MSESSASSKKLGFQAAVLSKPSAKERCWWKQLASRGESSNARPHAAAAPPAAINVHPAAVALRGRDRGKAMAFAEPPPSPRPASTLRSVVIAPRPALDSDRAGQSRPPPPCKRKAPNTAGASPSRPPVAFAGDRFHPTRGATQAGGWAVAHSKKLNR